MVRKKFVSTTILSVRKGNKVVMIGDGQVSQGSTVCKSNAVKVRTLYEGKILVGMAGSAGDCLTLIEHLEGFVESSSGNLTLACVNLVKAWRTDKMLRHLNANLCVADKKSSFLVSGDGTVLEPEDGLMAVGSGGLFALASAKTLVDNTEIDAEEIARKAMKIAADLCIYTNHNFVIEILTINE